MCEVVYDGQQEVLNNIIRITFSYWKSRGPKLSFHGVVSETAPDGVCCANFYQCAYSNVQISNSMPPAIHVKKCPDYRRALSLHPWAAHGLRMTHFENLAAGCISFELTTIVVLLLLLLVLEVLVLLLSRAGKRGHRKPKFQDGPCAIHARPMGAKTKLFYKLFISLTCMLRVCFLHGFGKQTVVSAIAW